jgi:hypothetical protein
MRDAIVIGPGGSVPDDYNVHAYFLISSGGKGEDLGIASQLLRSTVHVVGKTPKAVEELIKEILHNWTGAVEDLLEIKDDERPPVKTFEGELSSLINKYSKENGSNTPDFILAQYLNECLESFNKASRAREKWFGKELKIA